MHLLRRRVCGNSDGTTRQAVLGTHHQRRQDRHQGEHCSVLHRVQCKQGQTATRGLAGIQVLQDARDHRGLGRRGSSCRSCTHLGHRGCRPLTVRAERKACDVRLRAERRVGELLKELQRATPQTASPNGRAGKETAATVAGDSAYRAAIDANGISERSARRYQQLANVPRASISATARCRTKLPESRAAPPVTRQRLPRSLVTRFREHGGDSWSSSLTPLSWRSHACWRDARQPLRPQPAPSEARA